jgi:hypothetical protein
MIERVQRIHSHDAEQLQLADLLIGALSYLHRGLQDNAAKLGLVDVYCWIFVQNNWGNNLLSRSL